MFTRRNSPKETLRCLSYNTRRPLPNLVENLELALRTATRLYSVDAKTRIRSRLSYLSPHLVSTLDPALLSPLDCLDLSHQEKPTIRFPNSQPYTKGAFHYGCRPDGSRLLFPSHSIGFLHFYRDPDAAPLEGSIRFRVTSDSSPSSFHSGLDLLLGSGFPWQISLLQAACYTNFVRFRDQLLEDRLITGPQLAQCHHIASGRRHSSSQFTLFRLSQEFTVDFGSEVRLSVVGETLHTVRLNLFRAQRDGDHTQFHPWGGSALARFEKSTSPKHAGQRVICLRIVKIVTSISCTVDTPEGWRIVRPKEGELLNLCLHGGAPNPWSYDIDDKKTASAEALRILWDNSENR
ncbi:hypothetical protein K438DRAFT_1873387 [Mycena galopus ATCC 62051]|nr:hypothetical protein K438DRAFT_1873387 [Mycena galopus ATCC 62051]